MTYEIGDLIKFVDPSRKQEGVAVVVNNYPNEFGVVWISFQKYPNDKLSTLLKFYQNDDKRWSKLA